MNADSQDSKIKSRFFGLLSSQFDTSPLPTHSVHYRISLRVNDYCLLFYYIIEASIRQKVLQKEDKEL